jgi:hypothetical protein
MLPSHGPQFGAAYSIKELADVHVNLNDTLPLPNRNQPSDKLTVHPAQAPPAGPHDEHM